MKDLKLENFKSESYGDEKNEAGENRIFADYFREVIGKLNRSQLDWRLAGGFAMDSLCGEESASRRSNKTIRDVDIIVLNNLPEQQEELERYFEARRKEENNSSVLSLFPEVSLNEAKTEKYLNDREKIIRVPQLIPHILRKDDDFFLQFRDIEKKIDPEVLKETEARVKLGGEEINVKTFPPETILHMYLQRTGHIKPKDLEKIKDFAREIRFADYERLPHDLYLPFHDLAEEMRRKYKITTKALELYSCIDHRLFNSCLSHKLMPDKILKILLKS